MKSTSRRGLSSAPACAPTGSPPAGRAPPPRARSASSSACHRACGSSPIARAGSTPRSRSTSPARRVAAPLRHSTPASASIPSTRTRNGPDRDPGTAFLAALALSIALALAPSAAAAETGWHSEHRSAAGIGVPAPFGEIGDMAFWAPNRGVLITAGNEGAARRASTPTTGPAGTSTRPSAAAAKGGSPGPGRTNSGPSPTTRPPRKAEGGRDEGRGRTLCHFAERTKSSPPTPSRSDSADVLPADEGGGLREPDRLLVRRRTSGSGRRQRRRLPPALERLGADRRAVGAVAEPAIEEPPGAIVDLAAFAGRSPLESADGSAATCREHRRARGSRSSRSRCRPAANRSGPSASRPTAVSSGPSRRAAKLALRSVGAGFETVRRPANSGTVEAVGAANRERAAPGWPANDGRRSGAVLRSVSASGAVGPESRSRSPAEELDPKGAPTDDRLPGGRPVLAGDQQGWLFHLGGSLPNRTPTRRCTS